MIATMVFTMGILGVYMMMLKSYELVTLARHRDNARAILLAFADQFERLQTTDQQGALVVTRFLFQIATTPTGTGLSWTSANNVTTNGTSAGLPLMLGDSGSSQTPATVTRKVQYVDSTSGAPVAGVTATAAGWMLEATFTIQYSIKGRSQVQSLTVARSVR